MLASVQRLHRYAAPFAVVLDGVGQQVEQGLAQACGVGLHVQIQRAQFDFHATQLLQRPQQGQGLLHQRRQRHGLQGDAHFATFQRRQVQHVVDQAEQVFAGVVDVLQALLPLLPPLLFLRRRGGRLTLIVQQQLRKPQHGVEWGAQFMAHARQELGLGSAVAQRHLTFLAHGLRAAPVTDVPVDTNAAAPLGRGVVQFGRPRSQPAQLSVGPDDTELKFHRGAIGMGLLHAFGGAFAVFGVHAGQALGFVQRLCLRRQATQAPHLLVPVHLASVQVHFPGGQPGATHRQRHTLLGAAQRQLRAPLLGDVDDHAKTQDTVTALFALRMAQQMAHLAAHAQGAKAELHALGAAFKPGPRFVLDVRPVVGMHAALQPLDHCRHRLACGPSVDQAQLVAPMGQLLARFDQPVADASHAHHGIELPRHLAGAALLLLAFGDVQRHAQKGHCLPGVVAQHDAAQEMRAPLIVAAAVARFEVHRAVVVQGKARRFEQTLQVIGVHPLAHLFDAQALVLRLQTQ